MKIMTDTGLYICDVAEGGDLEQAMQDAGWVYNPQSDTYAKSETVTVVTPDGRTVTYDKAGPDVSLWDLRVAEEMSYREYKRSYSDMRTVKDSYNPQTKTITVLTPL